MLLSEKNSLVSIPTYLSGWISSCSYSIYQLIIIFPIRRLYMQGPEFSGIGGWGGKPNSQICAIMTDTAENIWIEQNEACEDLIERRFAAIRILYETCLYMFILCKILYDSINHFFYLRPIMRQMNRMQTLLEKVLHSDRITRNIT